MLDSDRLQHASLVRDCSIAAAVLHPAGLQTRPGTGPDGALAAWQTLLKLQTTASAMHTTAHPDDEHGGVLAMLSRGQGVRVSMLTLTRGESGDNAWVRALRCGRADSNRRAAGRRSALRDRPPILHDVIDYGFSKRLDEALESGERDNVLREVVRIIRRDRPFVLISGSRVTPATATATIRRQDWSPARHSKPRRSVRFPEQLAAGLLRGSR